MFCQEVHVFVVNLSMICKLLIAISASRSFDSEDANVRDRSACLHPSNSTVTGNVSFVAWRRCAGCGCWWHLERIVRIAGSVLNRALVVHCQAAGGSLLFRTCFLRRSHQHRNPLPHRHSQKPQRTVLSLTMAHKHRLASSAGACCIVGCGNEPGGWRQWCFMIITYGLE